MAMPFYKAENKEMYGGKVIKACVLDINTTKFMFLRKTHKLIINNLRLLIFLCYCTSRLQDVL